jgi:transcriptional regulator with XRE-family HTH domain
MDPIRLGLSLRALRIRRGWRQEDLGARAGVSRSEISAIERGACAQLRLGSLERVVAALGARLDVGVRWHGEGLDRLLDEAHAGLVDQLVTLLRTCGWDVAIEASFAIRGERGSIDVLAFHRATGMLLVVEVKSVVPDSQATLHTLDRKVRLAPTIAAERRWNASVVSRLLVVGEGTTARRRVMRVAATYSAALPTRGPAVKSWLRAPSRRIDGLMFLPYARPGGVRSSPTGIQRVRGPRRALVRRESDPFARDAGR